MPTPEAIIIENLFNVLDRDANVIPFKLNEAQRALDSNWTGRDLIPKARRMGVTTYVLARFTVACLTHENINCVVVSHERDATQRMLQTVKFFINNLRGPGAVISSLSRNRIAFDKTNSQFYIGTAGADEFGRGDTIHRLHCSEFAFWPHPEKLLKGLLQAVSPSGEIAIESTGNGLGSYARRCKRAWENQNNGVVSPKSYYCHFLNWLTEKAHTISLTPEEAADLMNNLDPDLEEDKVKDILTPEQMAFRRYKITEELDYDLQAFKQEFPITLEECFQASGNSLFWKVNYIQSPLWKKVDRFAWKLEGHPFPGYTYVLGGDPSGGVGQDNATIEVFCLDTNEQVYEYAYNKMPPDSFAVLIKEIGKLYNEALAVVENNNHGILTLSELRDIYPQDKIYYNRNALTTGELPTLAQLGFKTSDTSKPLAVGRLRKAVAGDTKIYSSELKGEMDSFVEDENGKMGAMEGMLDDRVMACAVAQMGWNDAAFSGAGESTPIEEENPFELNSILAELKQRGWGYPFPQQTVIH